MASSWKCTPEGRVINSVYQKFITRCYDLFCAIPINANEDQVSYALRICTEVAKHEQTKDAIDRSARRLRKAGHEFLALMFIQLSIFKQIPDAPRDSVLWGYTTAMNVYVHTAALYALNYKTSNRPRYDCIELKTWTDVAFIIDETKDAVHTEFLATLLKGHMTEIINDPTTYPVDARTATELARQLTV
jgi:hypothetical protein